jgi:O-antigen/teichoic acid export membrane protein
MLDYLRKISKNTIYYGLGQVSTAAISLILIPIYTRVLTPVQYGAISLILTIISIFIVFSDLGLGSALGVFYFDYFRDDTKLKIYLSSILRFLLVYGIFLVLFASLLGEPLVQPMIQSIPFYPFIIIAFVVGYCQTLFRFLQAFLQVQDRAKFYAIITSLSFLINVVLIVYFVVFRNEGILGNSKADLITAILFFLVTLFFFKKYAISSFNWKNLKESLKFGLPLVPHLLSAWIMKAVDRLFINHYDGLNQLGVYTLGFQIGSILSIFTNSFNSAWAPFFMATAKEKGEGAKPIITRLTTYYLACLFFLASCITLFTHEIISLVATIEYANSFQVVPIVVNGYILSGMYYMVVLPLYFTKKTKFLPLATLSGGIIQIILNYLFVPRYGMTGAAWAMFITNLWIFLSTWFISSSVYPLRFEFGRIIKIIIVYFLILLCGSFINYPLIWINLLTKIILLTMFPLLLFIFRFYDAKEILKIKTFMLGLLRNFRIIS